MHKSNLRSSDLEPFQRSRSVIQFFDAQKNYAGVVSKIDFADVAGFVTDIIVDFDWIIEMKSPFTPIANTRKEHHRLTFSNPFILSNVDSLIIGCDNKKKILITSYESRQVMAKKLEDEYTKASRMQ